MFYELRGNFDPALPDRTETNYDNVCVCLNRKEIVSLLMTIPACGARSTDATDSIHNHQKNNLITSTPKTSQKLHPRPWVGKVDPKPKLFGDHPLPSKHQLVCARRQSIDTAIRAVATPNETFTRSNSTTYTRSNSGRSFSRSNSRLVDPDDRMWTGGLSLEKVLGNNNAFDSASYAESTVSDAELEVEAGVCDNRVCGVIASLIYFCLLFYWAPLLMTTRCGAQARLRPRWRGPSSCIRPVSVSRGQRWRGKR